MINDNIEAAKELSLFYRVVTDIETVDESRAFFEDICTKKELSALAQRLDVAIRLKNGQSFNTISAETGASTATISRVSRCLSHGSGGYVSALEKLK